MLLLFFLLAAIVTVPLTGGSLRALADLRFRHTWLLVAALGTQVWLIARPGPQTILLTTLELGAYPLGVAFLWVNRDIPGFKVIALGAAMNFAAIAANGGIMPAADHAVALAGLPTDWGGLYANSAPIPHPSLLVLGDIFAVPSSLPYANVFSIGDLVVVIGAGIGVHRIAAGGHRSRASSARVLANGTLLRLAGGNALANLGAWGYSFFAGVVLAAGRGEPSDAVRSIGLLLLVQLAASGLAGATVAGPLADRASRRTVMLCAHAGRAVAVGSLAVVGQSDAALVAVAAVLGALGAIHRASLLASVPDIVDEADTPAAIAVVNATTQLPILVAPALAGYLVRTASPTAFFVGYTCALLAGAGLVWSARSVDANRSGAGTTFLDDLRLGWRTSLADPIVRGLAAVSAMAFLAVAWGGPIAPLLVREALVRGEPLSGLGSGLVLVIGTVGIGMLLGSLAAPGTLRRWVPQRLILVALLALASSVLLMSRTSELPALLLAWLFTGFAASLALVAVEALLLARRPDSARGRKVAAVGAVADLALLPALLAVGPLGAWLAAPTVVATAGWLILVAALGVLVLLPEPGSPPLPLRGSDSGDSPAERDEADLGSRP
jgi:predicted MFS family arabinose efflux permease